MSAQPLEALPLLAALAASLAGSLHCAGMCGPLRLLCMGAKGASVRYQAGRGLAYALLGAAAGGFGFAVPAWLLIALIAAGFTLSVMRVELLPKQLGALRTRALRAAGASPLLLGLASGLLPCGLLHGWVAAAAATAHPLRGALLLLVLWAGTVPALELAPGLLRRPLAAIRGRYPRALTVVLLAAALAPLALRLPALSAVATHGHPTAVEESKQCHGH